MLWSWDLYHFVHYELGNPAIYKIGLLQRRNLFNNKHDDAQVNFTLNAHSYIQCISLLLYATEMKEKYSYTP